ncbi:MAG: cupin domain-containing protein [Pyrinomonadaceae bacterium]
MAVILDGGCYVSEMREGTPEIVGSLKIWKQIGKNTGATAISLRVLEFDAGVSPVLRNSVSDDVLYFLEDFDQTENSGCSVIIDEQRFRARKQSGMYVRAGQTLRIDNPDTSPICFISAQCPDMPQRDEISTGVPIVEANAVLDSPPMVRLSDRSALPTADRWYRLLVDEEVGSTQVTQFIGSIPPGRAPDHFHNYEEVLFILRGEGRMWAGASSTSIRQGSCVYLPKRQVHCVENTGSNELRLLGVFYPAGSPAVRYETQ